MGTFNLPVTLTLRLPRQWGALSLTLWGVVLFPFFLFVFCCCLDFYSWVIN